MGVPVYYTMGNHDLMKKVPVPEYLYQENFGPVWYSFEAGNTHFIVLPMYIGDGKPTYTAEQNYRWLKNDLAHVDPDQNIVVVTHYNNTLGEQLVFKSKEGSIRFKDDDRFIAHILGHWHINHQRLIDGRIRYIVTSPSNKGGKDHSPSASPRDLHRPQRKYLVREHLLVFPDEHGHRQSFAHRSCRGFRCAYRSMPTTPPLRFAGWTTP